MRKRQHLAPEPDARGRLRLPSAAKPNHEGARTAQSASFGCPATEIARAGLSALLARGASIGPAGIVSSRDFLVLDSEARGSKRAAAFAGGRRGGAGAA